MRIDQDYHWYKLFSAKGIGPKTINKLSDTLALKRMELETVFEMSAEEIKNELGLTKKFFDGLSGVDDSEAFITYQKLKQKKVKVIHVGSDFYPKRLISTLGNNAPPILFSGGNLTLLKSNSISIVGSRNVSKTGIQLTKEIARELARNGFNIVSGYAKGVDTSAHFGALECDGTTTIVLSYGILQFRQKRDFRGTNWSGNVVVISQFSPDSKWLAHNAMARNKLIVALSDCIIVIESGPERDENGKMSGTFDTGKSALNLNIPLFVLSPSVSQNGMGNRELINRGGIEITPDNFLPTIKRQLGTSTKSLESKTLVQTALPFSDK